MTLSEKIKMLRQERGLTLEEVGNRVGVGKSTVRKWETGYIANMRRDKIALLADALGVSPGYLMGWDDTQEIREDEELNAIRERMRREPGQRTMFQLTKNASAEDLEKINKMIRIYLNQD